MQAANYGDGIANEKTDRSINLEAGGHVFRSRRQGHVMVDLRAHGVTAAGAVQVNLAPALLVEAALARREGVLASNGALVAYTGAYTGRAPKDKYIVAEAGSKDQIAWG